MIERQSASGTELAEGRGNIAPAALGLVRAYRRTASGWVTDAALEATVPAPAAFSLEGIAATQQTGPASFSAAGGFGSLSILWERIAGAGINALAPAAYATAFQAAALAEGETRTATFRAKVTDEASYSIFAGEVDISITRWTQPRLTGPASASIGGMTASLQTANLTAILTGGAAPFTVQWQKRTGGGAITATAPNALSTAFAASGLAQGETRTAIFDLYVSDSHGLEATLSVNVQISRYAPLSATVDANYTNDYLGSTSIVTSDTIAASASGGAGPYSYLWEKVSGGDISIVSPTSRTPRFRATSMDAGEQRSAWFRCTVTDSLGSSVVAKVSSFFSEFSVRLRRS